jgi:hypothetical protein
MYLLKIEEVLPGLFSASLLSVPPTLCQRGAFCQLSGPLKVRQNNSKSSTVIIAFQKSTENLENFALLTECTQ